MYFTPIEYFFSKSGKYFNWKKIIVTTIKYIGARFPTTTVTWMMTYSGRENVLNERFFFVLQFYDNARSRRMSRPLHDKLHSFLPTAVTDTRSQIHQGRGR